MTQTLENASASTLLSMHCTNISPKLTLVRMYFIYIIYIYVYIFMSIYIFKCTFRIINFSALSTLSITLENYKRNAVRFVSFIYIFYAVKMLLYVPRRTKSRLGRRTHLRGSRSLASSPISSRISPKNLFFFYKSFPI